jgi:hypothetical protein
MSTHLRRAAGVCVLTTGLLIGSAGGAIAAADTESTDSTNQSQTSDEPSPSVSTASAPTETVAETSARQSTRPTLRDVIRKLQLLGKPRQRPVVVKSTTDAVAADTVVNTGAADTGAANNETNSAEPDATPAVTGPAASDSSVVTSDSNVTAPVSNAVAPDSKNPAPSTDPVAPVTAVVQPVTTALTTVAGAALSVPFVIVSLPASTTPVADVITMIQNILTSVNEAVTLIAQVPSDLYSLLGATAMDATVVDSVGGSPHARLFAAAGGELAPPTAPLSPPVLPISPIGGVPLFGDVTAPAMLGEVATAGSSADLTLSGTAPLAADSVRPTDALSLIEHAIRAILAPASLTALAAFALPGVGGLLIICAAGARVGYRQAKAVLAARTTGISRFARQGPLGVVRSGSLVAVHLRHPRALRVVSPDLSRAAPLHEQAA